MKTLILSCCIILLCIEVQAQQSVYNSGNLTIASNASMMVTGDLVNTSTASLRNNGTLNLKSNLSNTGTFASDSGLTEFIGTALQQITGSTAFYNLHINNSSTGIMLNNSISVAHDLNMEDGNVDLNGSNITLGTLATLLNETNDKRIFGSSGVITTTRSLNAPNKLNVGGMGAILTTSANLGSTTVSRGHSIQMNGSDFSVQRYFDITPTNNSALDARLRFSYFDNELAGMTESDMVMWRSTDGGSTWSILSIDSADYSANYVVKSGIPAFSRWTINGQNWGGLPVELLHFTADCEQGNRQLSWAVASETNNSYFTVARSADGISYQNISTIQGAGNGGYHEYQYIDAEVLPLSTVYYRLQQTDNDGVQKTFPAVSSSSCSNETTTTQILIYPNPFTEIIYVRLEAKEAGTILLGIYDGEAKLLRSQPLECAVGMNVFAVDLQHLAKGEYHVTISQGSTVTSTMIMKN